MFKTRSVGLANRQLRCQKVGLLTRHLTGLGNRFKTRSVGLANRQICCQKVGLLTRQLTGLGNWFKKKGQKKFSNPIYCENDHTIVCETHFVLSTTLLDLLIKTLKKRKKKKEKKERKKKNTVEVGCAWPRCGTGANTSANLLWWPAAAQRTSIFVRGVPTMAEFMQYNN